MRILFAVVSFTFAFSAVTFSLPAESNDPRKIVELTNTVVAIGNAYSSTYRNYKTFLDNCEKAYERYTARYSGEAVKIGGGGPFYIPAVLFQNYTGALAHVPGDWNGREPVERAVAYARDTTAMLENAVTALRNYFEQGRFARDEFKSYNALHEGVLHYFEATRRSWNRAVSISIDAAREAELELLRDSPRAGFLIPMKTDLDALSALVLDIFGMAEDDYNFAPYILRNDNLRASIEKNRSVGDKNQSDKTAVTNYTMFYEYIANAAKALSSLMAELSRDAPNGNMVKIYVDQVNSSYEAAIQRYNNF